MCAIDGRWWIVGCVCVGKFRSHLAAAAAAVGVCVVGDYSLVLLLLVVGGWVWMVVNGCLGTCLWLVAADSGCGGSMM